MNQSLVAVAHELTSDKYLAFLLVLILLAAYLLTKNEAILQLLVVAVGLLGGLLRSRSTQNIASGEGATVRAEP